MRGAYEGYLFGRQQTVDRGPAHAQNPSGPAATDGSGADLRSELTPALAESLSVGPARAAEPAALAARTLHASPDALGQDPAFQLGVGGRNVVKRFPERGGRV